MELDGNYEPHKFEQSALQLIARQEKSEGGAKERDKDSFGLRNKGFWSSRYL
jgi:hypothetical protein